MKSLWLTLALALTSLSAHSQTTRQLLQAMTLRQKIGQITQPDIRWITPEEVQKYNIGSVLKGGGTLSGKVDNDSLKNNRALNWAKVVQKYKVAANKSETKIPLLFAIDAVHGHNNVTGATLFPHNIGLGATRDLETVKRIGTATAWEVFITGIDWNFAPTVAVSRNESWGRTYESFSEKTDFVTRYGTAYIQGLQKELIPGFSIIGTAKHWIGDGGTTKGIDQGDTEMTEAELRKIHLPPYVAAIKNNVKTMMASFNSWNGVKLHGHRYLIQKVLRDELGFQGVIVTDWNGIDQIKVPGGLEGDAKYMYQIAKAFNAGIDVYMVPENWKKFMVLTEKLVLNYESGAKPSLNPKRLDEAVYRILKLKKDTNLDKKPLPMAIYNKFKDRFGSEKFRNLAAKAAKQSAVLLKKETKEIISTNDDVLVIGEMASNTGFQAGGWSLAWQGVERDIPGSTSILDGLKEKSQKKNFRLAYSKDGITDLNPTKIVLVIGELPYAEGKGDQTQTGPLLPKGQIKLLNKALSFNVPVTVILITGRPLLLPKQMDKVSTLISYWLPGTMGGAIADLLVGEETFTGKLSFSWPATKEQVDLDYTTPGVAWKYPLGHGLN